VRFLLITPIVHDPDPVAGTHSSASQRFAEVPDSAPVGLATAG